jgi:hypothetical protein
MVARVHVDIRDAIGKINLIDRESRIVAYWAVKATVDDMQKGLRREMQRLFDRPTPVTLNSLYGKYPAKRVSAEFRGEVGIKDDEHVGMKGRWKLPASRFLLPQIYGGPRSIKAFERMLQRRNILPERLSAVPGEGMRLDAYGNMSRGQLVQILSWFDSFTQDGYRANMGRQGRVKLGRGTKRRRGVRYFAVNESGQRFRPGIWMTTETSFGWSEPICVIAFVRRPQYRQRFHFHLVAREIADRELLVNFRLAKDRWMRESKIPMLNRGSTSLARAA